MEELVSLIVAALRASPIPRGISDEKLFEHNFVEPAVVEAVRQYELSLDRPPRRDGMPHVEVALHGWKPRGVRDADLDPETRERSKKWTRSKKWSVTNAWGRHTPDIAIRDTTARKTLVIEVKFADVSGGGLRTTGLQRMVGQCVIAKRHHDGVVAVFGYRGKLSRADEVGLEPWLQEQGIGLVIREVPG